MRSRSLRSSQPARRGLRATTAHSPPSWALLSRACSSAAKYASSSAHSAKSTLQPGLRTEDTCMPSSRAMSVVNTAVISGLER